MRMLIGHDPGMHVLAVELAGAGDAKSLEALAAKFPTAALAVIHFKCARLVEDRAGARPPGAVHDTEDAGVSHHRGGGRAGLTRPCRLP